MDSHLSPHLARYRRHLAREAISSSKRARFEQWLLCYSLFCERRDLAPYDLEARGAFLRFLEEKQRGAFQVDQARKAIALFFQMMESRSVPSAQREMPLDDRSQKEANDEAWEEDIGRLCEEIRRRHYSPNTLRTYAFWLRALQAFLHGKSPDRVDAGDAARFFTHLACRRGVSASTQNQAFSSLLFVFRYVWKRPFEGFDGVTRAKRSRYIPTVLSRSEIDRVFERLDRAHRLMVELLYGCGLRRFEVVNLRVG
ncbi:site-specific integrase [Pelagicoccus sp. SDUM812003]|uniref:tyrosine-type recombinase/integrase n=1 Tax=Pelagicoccus sp. SDUM812003 TaxID=3041267 RepID=UPI0028100785|nr:site-specific integrase [Pelagicoccus sp. SDUM812003]MDQ8201626.1 site-specific integrase [Pelagicoccus sp. SDUM812003]